MIKYTPLSQREVLELAKQYNYKCKFINDSTLEIKSVWNHWFCHIHDGCLELRHMNKGHDKKHDHMQRIYYDFVYLFDSIKTHEEYEFSRTRKKVNYWNRLFEQIHTQYQSMM